MNKVGQIERTTQNRVVKLFTDQLQYRYLGIWQDREGNSNIEEKILSTYLQRRNYSDSLIKKAIFDLTKTAGDQNKGLYELNKEVYTLLRYGVKVKPEAGANNETIELIDWKNPENNDFAIAEEVTINGENKKRPDIVLYINGLAVGVLELKRSTISIEEGIRQNIDNQKEIFIRRFFATAQLIMSGNDTAGLRYGTIETPEKQYLGWKEQSQIENPLDRYLTLLCNKERLLEILHDFMVFDRGTKKICRPNQYFGVKASQENIRKREGGIIWQSQGSGKSLIMIWLAKWIRENINNSRILIITDRDELDKQIEGDFIGVNEKIYRTKSGKDLIERLNES